MTGLRTPKAEKRSGTYPVQKKVGRLVLGLGESGLAFAVEKHFRQLGWDVVLTATSEEAGRIVHREGATTLVLVIGEIAEGGLLTCAKLSFTRPNARVLLLGPEDAKLARHARYAGAAGYLPDCCGVPAIVRAVLGG